MTPNRDPIDFSHADHSGLFDILASTAVDGIIIIDSDGHIIFSNAACEKLFQYPAQEIAGQNVSMLMPEPYRSEHDSYLDHYKTTGDAHIIGIGREVTGRRKDGSTFPMYLSVGEGHLDRRRVFVGIVHDLTDFHAEAESRRKSDQHLLAVLDSSEDAVLSKDLNGIVTSWNFGAARIFGYSADEMIGSSISILFPPDRLSEEEEILRGIRAGKAVRQYETTRRRKDGMEISISLSVSPIRDENGQIVGASKIARDITEQRRAEAQSAKLQEELAHIDRVNVVSQLSSALAHELNQPLTAIMNYVGAAKLRVSAIEDSNANRAETLLDKTLEQADRAGAIIKRLRAFLEKREADRTTQDLNALVREALAIGFVGSADDDVELIVDLASDLPAVEVDRVQIEQVIVNLVRNAVDAMRGGDERKLSISSYKVGTQNVELSVSDTGPGVHGDVAAKLFEPFVTTKASGMGIGLSICRTMVEAHGGRIWLAPSEKGAVFKMQLPTRDND